MKLKLISIDSEVLSLDNAKYATVPTLDWVITVMDWHEAIVSALTPWVLEIEWWSEVHEFAIWGWVLETDWDSISIIADMVESWDDLTSDDIQSKLDEAKKLLKDARDSWKQSNSEDLLTLEEDYLKIQAKSQLLARR